MGHTEAFACTCYSSKFTGLPFWPNFRPKCMLKMAPYALKNVVFRTHKLKNCFLLTKNAWK